MCRWNVCLFEKTLLNSLRKKLLDENYNGSYTFVQCTNSSDLVWCKPSFINKVVTQNYCIIMIVGKKIKPME